MRADQAKILAANARDMAAAGNELSAALRDRLMLDGKRVEAMAQGLEEVAALPDPVGTVLERWSRPNGLDIARVRIPLGVIGIIYESRPNVTADAGGLCLRAGNAVILRGGSESFHSSTAIAERLAPRASDRAGLPEDAVQLVPTRDRAAVGMMLTMAELIDVIVPRGGRSLIERVQRESRIPVIAHLEGNCHVYVDGAADLEKARRIVLNAKMRRTGVCGAAETLLVDRAVAKTHLPPILADLHKARLRDPRRRGRARARSSRRCRDRGGLDHRISRRHPGGARGRRARRAPSRTSTATARTTPTPSSPPTTRRPSASSPRSTAPSCCVNASTQFADGGEFGMGAEIGISTEPPAAARPGRRRAAHDLQIRRPRHRPGAPLSDECSGLGLGRKPPRRVGLLGGSFNPAHSGHRHISLEALKRLGLDEVWWLVSPQNPLKPRRGMAPFARRLDAARAFARHPRIRVARPRSAARHALHRRHGGGACRAAFRMTRFVWLMGADNLAQMPHWRRWTRDILARARCGLRPPYLLSKGLARARGAAFRAAPRGARARRGASPG